MIHNAEEAASRGDQGKVYEITKLVSGKYWGTTDSSIMDNRGRLLTIEAEQEARWGKHFSEVLNRPPPPTEADVQDPEEHIDLNTTPQRKKRS